MFGQSSRDWKRLELFAIDRALICMSVNFSGVDQRLKDAQYVFEEAFKDLAPCCGRCRIQGGNANAKN